MASPRHRPSRSDSVVALSEGQRIALAQLRRIADTDRSPISIVGVDDDPAPGASLNVDISLDCTHLPACRGGPAAPRPRGHHAVAARGFPVQSAIGRHRPYPRFHGFGHVQWGTPSLHLPIHRDTVDPFTGHVLDSWRSSTSGSDAEPEMSSTIPKVLCTRRLPIRLPQHRSA